LSHPNNSHFSAPNHHPSPVHNTANPAPHPLHFNLQIAARASMLEHGFEPDFPSDAAAELTALRTNPAEKRVTGLKDLRNLLWSSIDNDTSRDLDQIEWAEQLADGRIRVLVAVADVDASVPKGSAIDHHAGKETTSVYTGVKVFPMLPTDLSEDLTSLNENEDRLAMVYDYCVNAAGEVSDGKISRAVVRNKAQLAYGSVGAWLEGKAEAPPKVAASAELAAQLKLQDAAAQLLRKERYQNGALDIETIETHPVLLAEDKMDIETQEKNRATELIEEFMVGANGVVARTLSAAGLASIRRIVRVPKRWDRIVEVAAQMGTKLPADPDSKALNEFLINRRKADPDHFPDLSLTIVKLMGPGEYVMDKPGSEAPGHFGLAVQDYTHSTAPNRRYADLITHRVLKAWMNTANPPYSSGELEAIAFNCTQKEDGARKVEREMQKRIAAVVLAPRVGQSFDGIVTGVNHYGTFVRILQPHAEGMLVQNSGKALDVGDRVHVKLISTNPEQGFIDFAC